MADRITCAAVDAIARAVIEDAGYGSNFRHRLGHAIGWDVHEPPFLAKSHHVSNIVIRFDGPDAARSVCYLPGRRPSR